MEFVRAKKSKLGLDMAPLIDIVFQLLIFFMLTSSFLNPSLRLDLPKAISADSREKEVVVVSVSAEGGLFINTNEVTFETFQEKLVQRLANLPKKIFTI